MNSYTKRNSLNVDNQLLNLIENEILPDTGILAEQFWSSFSHIVETCTPINIDLLNERDNLQSKIDQWHKETDYDVAQYEKFLRKINYIVEEPKDFSINPVSVDDEIALLAGPQLVVPVNNARFALNATNARWGSLFDALYATDIIAETNGCEKGKSYNEKRGAKVVESAQSYLDTLLPLNNAKHCDITTYKLINNEDGFSIEIYDINNQKFYLMDPNQFIGFNQIEQSIHFLFKHNGLHFALIIDPTDSIASKNQSNIKDIILESALTTIADCEDSVAAVDAQDKCAVYKNWLGLMKGNLTETFFKNGKELKRSLNNDKHFTSLDGQKITLQGRSLLFNRNVGHLMKNPAIKDNDDNWVFEGIMDAMITVLCSLHDLKNNSPFKNSLKGSIYIVKPKMHGPDEVAFCDLLFSEVEKAYSLEPNTIKVGVMDEEKRTSVNLKACIEKVKDRIVFINTGFLDRTGDEIHTCMQAGPVVPKEQFKSQKWIQAYEKNNVSVGLQCGFLGKGQIGKGMWPKPDLLSQMMQTKHIHPLAGANCAWVPSPTAATLHVLHYHIHHVSEIQHELLNDTPVSIQGLLTLPLARKNDITKEMIDFEIENNLQGILGYVVRWVDQGIGCSKVLDIHNEGLMEDRATLRISSQLLANWLLHNIIDYDQLIDALKKMANFVDIQNKSDTNYINMFDSFDDNIAIKSTLDLILNGVDTPNGYTEPSLHARRLDFKKTQ